MFKLLAIRPLEGCADYIQKCLKTGMMYYFCNDYIIEPGSHIRRRSKNIKPLKEDFFTVVSESDYSEDNRSERKSPTVSVSAIVGMNGDGKSTLVELMMRLINNCAISYELCASSDNSKGKKGIKTEPHYNLRRVENAKAELYYMIDNVIYRMAEEKDQKETRIWKVSELNPINEKGEEIMRWEIDSVEIQKVEDDPKGFFFTIVSNYSHYAYNIYDYRKEWEIRGGEKDDDEKCWLHYVFHKNDGYLTPITLHPYRYKGNIDINVEKDLSKQRLLSLFLNAENPKEKDHSFRSVNGKDANVLKLTEETESKLQKNAIVEYFEITNQTNRFRELIEEIDLVNDEVFLSSLLLGSNEDYNKNYNRLIESLENTLIKPVKQIIEQGDDFSVFANDVANWMRKRTKTKFRKSGYNGDIITVLRHYNNQFYRNETFTQMYEWNKKAMEKIAFGDYALALEYFKNTMEISESQLGPEHIITALVFNDIAVMCECLYDYEKALYYYSKAIEIKESKLDNGHLSIAITYSNMASAYRKKGEYDKAMECCITALSLVESSANPLMMVKTYNNIALVYEDLKKYGEALNYYIKALGVIRDNKLDESSLTVSIYINTARVYKIKGEHDKSVKNYNQAIQVSSRLLQLSIPNVAELYDNIAWAYIGEDKYNKAFEFFKKALDVKQESLGKDHAEIAMSYDNIALVNIAISNYQEAVKNYNEALDIRKNVFGDNHFQTAFSYENKAWALFKKGELYESTNHYANALRIMKGISNMNPLVLVATYNNAAGVCVINGSKTYKKAMHYYDEAMKISERFVGEHQLFAATICNNKALLCIKKGNYDVAFELFKNALNTRKSVLGEDNLDLETATIYNCIAIACKNIGNRRKALANYIDAFAIKRKVLGEMDFDTAMSYCKVAWVFYEMSDYDKASEIFEKVLRIMERILGYEDPNTIEYYRVLAVVYKKKGDYVKAWNYYDKALKKKRNNLSESNHTAALIDEIIMDVWCDESIKALKYFEEDELKKQLSPKNERNETPLGKGKMERILENYDAVERIRNTKKQELIDTNKYKYLKIINSAQLGRIDTIFRIVKSYNNASKDATSKIDLNIVTKVYSDLSLKEKCQHYIVYKIYSIVSKYPQYQKAQKKDGAESIREFGFALEECVQDILNDHQSHITRKIRQVENFMKEDLKEGGLYKRLGTREKKSDALLVELDKLKNHYEGKSFSLDNIPPPIYKWDIVFKKKDDNNCDIELDSFSSGEKQMLNSIGVIIYHLQNLANTSSEVKYGNVNLIMEEIELYYHPEYQRLFFLRLLDLIQRANLENIQNINIVFVTHSPFILSDIPKCNVLFLKDGMPKDIMQENTFGANIHTLLKNGFFMPNLPIGEFAYGKINELFKTLNTGEFNSDDEEKRKKDLNDIYQQILLVGEPFLRNQLLMLYNAFKGSSVVPMRTNEKGMES